MIRVVAPRNAAVCSGNTTYEKRQALWLVGFRQKTSRAVADINVVDAIDKEGCCLHRRCAPVQARPALLPGALLCPCRVNVWAMLVESKAIVDVNEVRCVGWGVGKC